MKEERIVTVEYGNDNLKEILSEYIIQDLVKILNEE